MADSANPVLLYDGVCGLCNYLVQFVLQHDADTHFSFAPLQSEYAARILRPLSLDPSDLNTIYVVASPGGRVLQRSNAVIFVLRQLGGFWRALSVVLSVCPQSLRDWGYGVARHPYRVFGKYETCRLPERQYQDRFLDR